MPAVPRTVTIDASVPARVPAPAAQAGPCAIFFDSISKRFGPVAANSSVSFSVRAGTVHVLLGENGAGKSTLVNMLAGLLQPDEGAIHLHGLPVSIRGPRDAQLHGVGVMHQHFALVPALTIAENLLLDATPGSWRSHARATEAFSRLLPDFGLQLDLDTPVYQLSSAQRQMVELCRALAHDARVLVLDEPTSVLSPVEGDQLLGAVRQLTSTGVAVLLVTHKLREIELFADVVTVLRQGRSVGTFTLPDTPIATIMAAMVGQDGLGRLRTSHSRPQTMAGAPNLLTLDHVSACNAQGRQMLHDVSLSLRAGSVVGVAGLAGSGQEELAGCIAGLMPVRSGQIHRDERVGDVAYIPADRLGLAAPAELRVIDNITLHDYWKTSTRFQALLGRNAWRQMAGDRCQQFNVKTPGLHVPTGCLSGGNIQRVIIARELARPASVIVAHNPTAGLDIEGVAFVRRQLLHAVRADGRAVLLISDDLDELLELSDEIVVLCKGRAHGPFPAAALDRTTIGRLMLVTG